MYQPACDLPERGYFFRPTLFTNVAQSHRIAREEIFGPVLSVLTFRTPDEAVEKANNTAYGLSAGIWTEKGSRILADGPRMKAGVVWANTFNRFDPTSPFGGYKESGLRSRGRHARPPRLRPARGPLRPLASATPTRAAAAAAARSTSARPTSCTSAARSRGPRAAARTSSRAADGDAARERLPRVAQGPPRRRPGGARAFQGWADRTAMNRGQVLYRVAELMEGRRDQFAPRSRWPRACAAGEAREVVDRAIDRWVWYAGWADKIAQVLGSSNPVAAPYFNFTIPEPTGVVGVVAPETSSLLGLVSRLAPALVARQRRGRPRLRDAAAAGHHPDRGPRHVRRPGRRRQRADRPASSELVPVLAAHVDVDALDVWGVPDALRVDAELLAADT